MTDGGFSDWTGVWIELGLIVAYFVFSAIVMLWPKLDEDHALDTDDSEASSPKDSAPPSETGGPK